MISTMCMSPKRCMSPKSCMSKFLEPEEGHCKPHESEAVHERVLKGMPEQVLEFHTIANSMSLKDIPEPAPRSTPSPAHVQRCLLYCI